MKAKYIGDICLSPDWVKALQRVYPQGIHEGGGGIKYLRFELDSNSEEFRKIEAALQALGMRRWNKKKPMDLVSEYWFKDRVEWEPDDFKDTDYATALWPKKVGLGVGRTSDGLLQMEAGHFPVNGTVIRAADLSICVTERVKGAIEGENFRGVQFRPTVLMSGASLLENMKPTPWSKSLTSWWEMTSDIELPALSPTTNLLGEDYEPLVERTLEEIRRRGCLVDGPRWEALLHYRKRDLKKVEPFDLARTHEPFGGAGFIRNTGGVSRKLVGSTRFREFFRSKKWKLEWEPVVIE